MIYIWIKYSIIFHVVNFVFADDLIFVQSVWRHGDRLPTETYPNDRLQESDWMNLTLSGLTKSFQGFGQLTAKGMAQHNIMGQRLKERYVKANDADLPNGAKILSPLYKMKEIYVRSTDVNRTIMSAMSNLIGMLDFGTLRVDYPDNTTVSWNTSSYVSYTVRWPSRFIPIPVHTVDDNTDHIGNPDADCVRQTKLWDMVMATDEYKNLTTENSAFLASISNVTGMTITLDNLWEVHDVISIKRDNNLTNETYLHPWLNDAFSQITNLNNIVEDWNNGLNLSLNKNPAINFTVELSRIRGGALLWDMIFHIQAKINCSIHNSSSSLCTWINPLKYYAYSAHDTTLAALATTLGFKKTNYDDNGYPLYSTTVTIELWNSSKDGTFYIKVYYWPLNNDTDDVTDQINGCTTNCTVDAFYNRSIPFKPGANGDITSWCNYLDDLNLSSTSDSEVNAKPIFLLSEASLWCQQGGAKRDFSPTQCDEDTAECFKLVCQGGKSPFTARGCGLTESKTAMGLRNESCFQAIGVCQQMNGTPSCVTCRDKHLCNTSPPPTTTLSLFSYAFLLIVNKIFT